MIQAAAKASNSQLTVADITCLIEKEDVLTSDEIVLIPSFVRYAAADESWLWSIRSYGEVTQELTIGGAWYCSDTTASHPQPFFRTAHHGTILASKD